MFELFWMAAVKAVLPKWFAVIALIILHLTDAEKVPDDHIDDPEPEVTWTPPPDESAFKFCSAGANYSGLLYAGVVEFNWVVDLRTRDDDQEYWAVGNLISFYHVMTTCRAVDLLQRKSPRDSKEKLKDPNAPDVNWNIDVYRSGNTGIRINYCENYLWAEATGVGNDVDRRTTGSRSVKRVIRHPNCNPNKLEFDVAMITMWSAIPAIEPRLGYMPTGFDYASEKYEEKVKLDFNQPITYASPLCYVASFGKNSVNHKEFYVLDYKVRYRVYITKWADCREVWSYICNEEGGDRACRDNTVPEQGRDFLMCVRPRSKVGTICDHDRGAPLVCNGQVIGLVVRGPKFKYCNNLFKIPFVVEKIDHYKTFFDQSVFYVVTPVPRKEDVTEPSTSIPKGRSRATSILVTKLLYVGTIAILFTSFL